MSHSALLFNVNYWYAMEVIKLEVIKLSVSSMKGLLVAWLEVWSLRKIFIFKRNKSRWNSYSRIYYKNVYVEEVYKKLFITQPCRIYN